MTNIAHASLTGADLHEPKGATTAALGTVYVADGVGSGSWANVGTSSFTGMIADFTWPVVQAGWLELDGSDINTTTYAALYAVMAIQHTGTRVNGSAIITSLPETATLRSGYYVFGTGIASGTTIATVDSSTQVTLSAPASSTGTANIAISPWLLNSGTIRLPDMTTAGRFRRSRASGTNVGQTQASQNLAHTHAGATYSGLSGSENSDHTHSGSGNTGVMSTNANHQHNYEKAINSGATSGGGGVSPFNLYSTTNTTVTNLDHTHSFSFTTTGRSTPHQHAYSGTTDVIPSAGSSEARPIALVVMTCVKT